MGCLGYSIWDVGCQVFVRMWDVNIENVTIHFEFISEQLYVEVLLKERDINRNQKTKYAVTSQFHDQGTIYNDSKLEKSNSSLSLDRVKNSLASMYCLRSLYKNLAKFRFKITEPVFFSKNLSKSIKLLLKLTFKNTIIKRTNDTIFWK